MAVRGGEPPVIVELKRRFALSLVYQCIERQRITDAVYLAIAAPTGRKARAIWDRKRGAVLQLCRRLGLGLMTVDARDPCAPQVDVHLDPAPYAPRKSRARRKHCVVTGSSGSQPGNSHTGGASWLLLLIAMELSLRAFVTVLRTALLCALLQIGVALGLTFLLALLMNWPVKTAVLLGFIVIAQQHSCGDHGRERNAVTRSCAFVFSPRCKKAAPCGAAEFDREEVKVNLLVHMDARGTSSV